MSEDHALGAVGLSAIEEDMYRALLSLPEADVAAMAQRLRLSEGEVSTVLDGLMRRGLAKMVSEHRYAALAPESSLVTLLEERLDGLRRGYAVIGELEQVYRQARSRYGGVDVETVCGPAAIRSRVDQLHAAARQEVCMFMRQPLVDIQRYADYGTESAAVRHRTLYEKALLDDPEVMELIRHSVSQGVQVRFAATLPVKLMVVDQRIAMILESGSHPVGLVVEHPALVTMATGLFEQVWPSAVPAPVNGDLAVGPPEESGLSDPDDRLLLSLLLAGLTDQAIAARLGVGLRTVQRRVRDLMDAANVDTRIQLGWQASRKGWVT